MKCWTVMKRGGGGGSQKRRRRCNICLSTTAEAATPLLLHTFVPISFLTQKISNCTLQNIFLFGAPHLFQEVELLRKVTNDRIFQKLSEIKKVRLPNPSNCLQWEHYKSISAGSWCVVQKNPFQIDTRRGSCMGAWMLFLAEEIPGLV